MCWWWWQCICVYKDFLCVCKLDTYKNVAILMFAFIYIKESFCTTNVDEANNVFSDTFGWSVCVCFSEKEYNFGKYFKFSSVFCVFMSTKIVYKRSVVIIVQTLLDNHLAILKVKGFFLLIFSIYYFMFCKIVEITVSTGWSTL